MGFFKSIAASLTEPNNYPELIKKTTGKSIAYLVLLVLLFGTPVMINISWSYNQEIDSILAAAQTDLPDFSFTRGELEVYADMPLIIPGEDQQIIIIDTTGKTKASVLDKYQSGILISRYQLINKESALKTETLNFSEIKQLTFDKADVLKWIPLLKVFWVFLLLGGLVMMILGKLLAVVILSLLGLLLSKMQKHNLTYDQSLRLSAHALTAPIIFQACKDIVYPQLPLNGLIYYTIFIIYMWLAIKALKDQESLI